MKKRIIQILSLVLVLALGVGLLTSCGSSSERTTIDAITRESGSGTRGAFTEMLGIVDDKGVDAITPRAEVTNSTAVMTMSTYGNRNAIGFISLGSMSSTVKAVKVDGVAPSVKTINEGKYKLVRPFEICYKPGSLSPVAQDFIKFILSRAGQKIIDDAGYLKMDNAKGYRSQKGTTGTISIAGSTSVGPVMERLADQYMLLNPKVTIEIEQNGSSAGIQAAEEGVVDFGMASRALEGDETKQLESQTIAKDGIVVIVNKKNPVNNLTSAQIRDIYLGKITDWSQVQ